MCTDRIQTYPMMDYRLRVDWKSDKYRDEHHHPSKITPTMDRCLRSILQGHGRTFQARTVKALQWRDLLDESQNLTGHGKAIALMGVPLQRQCDLLNIPFEQWEVSSRENPEERAISVLVDRGFRAYFIENSFGLFIDYVMGIALVDAGTQLDRPIYTLNPPYDLELFWCVKERLEEYLSQLVIDHCEKSRAICSPYLSRQVPGETADQIFTQFDKIYRALGLEKVRCLLRMYFANPLAYNYRGWPDLFVADPKGPYCIEVKTTDKLNLNQLVTIPDLMTLAGIPVKVVRLLDIDNRIDNELDNTV